MATLEKSYRKKEDRRCIQDRIGDAHQQVPCRDCAAFINGVTYPEDLKIRHQYAADFGPERLVVSGEKPVVY